ncbi:MAG: heavy-metal-associated domain-containing protein [Hyphomicrobiales bacterium]|nr:heavy-metal-associated domain-containing protein [Hyphomicrobiales bacterium]
MLTLTVSGMHCGGCVATVQKVITEVDSAANVEIDLPTGRVDIITDEPREKIVAAIEDAGYDVVG